MIYVLGVVLVVVIVAALIWGARRSREADEELKYLNEGRGVGNGILGIFGRGRRRP